MSNKVNLPVSELPTLLESLKGHKYTYITTRTIPGITKKHRVTKQPLNDCYSKPEGRTIIGIVKEREFLASLNADYENMVNNRQEKATGERTFETGSLPWGEWVEGSKVLILHKGEYYCRMYELTGNKLADSVKQTVLFKVLDNGMEIPFEGKELEDVYENFMPSSDQPKKTILEGSHDEFKPITTSPKCSSITSIRIEGHQYFIK